MSTVFCLDCDRELTLIKDGMVKDDAVKGGAVDDIIICDGCKSEFEIVSREPLEITWFYPDYDEDDAAWNGAAERTC